MTEGGRWAHVLRWTSSWGRAFWTQPLFSVTVAGFASWLSLGSKDLERMMTSPPAPLYRPRRIPSGITTQLLRALVINLSPRLLQRTGDTSTK